MRLLCCWRPVFWNAIEPSVPFPNSAVQMRAWASENLKAHGILFLTLSQAVKDKITALCGTTGAERFFFFFL
jgi:hypothetical protein